VVVHSAIVLDSARPHARFSVLAMKIPSVPVIIAVAMFHPAWCAEETAADPNADNLASLEKSAATYVEAFNKADAKALAATYLPGGEITLADGTVVSGREAITEFYQETLNAEPKPKVALEAGSVRFVTPGVAIECGTLHVTAGNGEVSSHPYTAVQVKQEDGSWLTASVRSEADDEAEPSEKLLGLDWIIGDWIIQRAGTETSLSFGWSDFGPYIEGEAEVAQSTGGSDRLQIRIGWDNQRKGFVSWSHDSDGGFVQSEWTETGTLNWLLRTKGVTAAGESNEYTQLCTVDPARQSFTWTIRDQTIGGEAQPERVLTAVKRPPPPKRGDGNAE